MPSCQPLLSCTIYHHVMGVGKDARKDVQSVDVCRIFLSMLLQEAVYFARVLHLSRSSHPSCVPRYHYQCNLSVTPTVLALCFPCPIPAFLLQTAHRFIQNCVVLSFFHAAVLKIPNLVIHDDGWSWVRHPILTILSPAIAVVSNSVHIRIPYIRG